MRAFLQTFYANPDQLTEQTLEGYWRVSKTNNWECGALGQIRDEDNSAVPDETLTSIQSQTVIIWGEDDQVTPLSDGRKLTTLLPKAQLYTIAHAGHLPMEEQPSEFNRIALLVLPALTK